jgi:hypothetical protein
MDVILSTVFSKCSFRSNQVINRFIKKNKKKFGKLRVLHIGTEAVRHEQVISDAGWSNLDFAERDSCRPVLLRLSLARKPGKISYVPLRDGMEGARLPPLERTAVLWIRIRSRIRSGIQIRAALSRKEFEQNFSDKILNFSTKRTVKINKNRSRIRNKSFRIHNPGAKTDFCRAKLWFR